MILRRKRLQRSSAPKRGGPLKRGKGVRRVSAKRRGVIAADAEWARKVKYRDGEECQLRGNGLPMPPDEEFPNGRITVLACMGGLDAHHVYRKGNHPRLRHDVSNGLALCRRHHQYAHTAEGIVFVQRWLYSVHFQRWWALGEKAKRESRLLE